MTLGSVYKAGRDSVESGVNTTNTGFMHFLKPAWTKAWQRGRDDAIAEIKLSLLEAQVLRAMSRLEFPIATRRIAVQLGMRPPIVYGAIYRLRQKKLVDQPQVARYRLTGVGSDKVKQLEGE